MTPSSLRARVLRAITAERHLEPFTWRGLTFHARAPSQLEVEVASQFLKHGATAVAARLALYCVEANGERVFEDADFKVLLKDEQIGFLNAFWTALLPFLSEPPPIPSLSRKEHA